MKKLIIKLAAFSIVSALISANAVLAAGSGDLGMYKKLDFAKTKQCVKDKKDEPDFGFLITYIEEPLDAKTDESKPDFKQRICYRHTLQWTDEKLGVQTLEELSNKDAPCQTLGQGELASISAQTITDLKVKYSCRQIQAVLSKGGTSLLYGYIGMVYRWGASMVGIVAVLVIVISGIQISAGGGDPEAINSAKKRIIQSIAGIVILFLSGLILYTINPTFFTK